jgi:hypothetical protein
MEENASESSDGVDMFTDPVRDQENNDEEETKVDESSKDEGNPINPTPAGIKSGPATFCTWAWS